MTIGFIGLGAFGERIASRLVNEGHGLMIHDLVTDAVRYFMLRHSADVAERPRMVARLCDTIVCVLPSAADVRQVSIGPMGVADGLEDGKRVTLIDLGTSSAKEAMQLAADLAPRGVDYVEAPAYGSTADVREGKLVIPYGCNDTVVSKAREVLESLSSRVSHTGEPGSAHAFGAFVEQIRAGALLATVEAIVAGKAAGVSPQALLDWSQAAGLLAPAVATAIREHALKPGNVGSGHSIGALTHNLALALDLARDHKLSLRQSEAALETWRAAQGDRGAEADHADILRWLEANAPVKGETPPTA